MPVTENRHKLTGLVRSLFAVLLLLAAYSLSTDSVRTLCSIRTLEHSVEPSLHNMVYYEDSRIDHSHADMYSHYSPSSANVFNITATSNATYEPSPYHTAVPTVENLSTAVPYYDQNYRPTYWQQPQAVKDDQGMMAYQQPTWQAYHHRDNAELYKQQHEYLALQNAGHNVGQQSPGGVGTQYPPCAMMSGANPHQAMEEEIGKDRQTQSYNNWMTGTTSSNCKTRTKDKYRVVYSDHQRLELEKEFHYSRYITIRRKAELAVNLSLSERQVKIWFQNRRAKERKMNKKKSTDDTKCVIEAESRSSPYSSDGNDEES